MGGYSTAENGPRGEIYMTRNAEGFLSLVILDVRLDRTRDA